MCTKRQSRLLFQNAMADQMTMLGFVLGGEMA
jgi:uncharacterized lipoprotein YajG